MSKYDKFLASLDGHEVTANNGDVGYIVTVGDLIKNGGRDDFFRKCRKSSKGGYSVSRDVYEGLEYDKESKAWYADCYTNICYHSGPLHSDTVIFIGFTF